MRATIFFAGSKWFYETGNTLVGVVGFVEVDAGFKARQPGYDFAFAPECDPRDQGNVEDEIRAQIQTRFPELFPKPNAKRVRKSVKRS